MKNIINRFLAISVLVLGYTTAYADGDRLSVPDNPKWKEECGSCHIAFPPQLLTADNWQRLMGRLDDHFGTNATMDDKDAREISDFLQRYAGQNKRYSSQNLRISDTLWFTREHREVSRDAWKNPAVKSRSNCTACHVNAERGDWSERGIRMPRGLSMEGGEGREDDD